MAGTGIDKALGISPQVLQLRMQRMNLLAANIANANTPDYKARDIDFRASLQAAQDAQGAMRATNDRHIPLAGAGTQPEVLFRTPSQTSPDGNTVDAHQEHSAFMDNALRYQASLQLLDSRIKGIKNAIKGESS
ncbi:MAG: flagellar basal body rod protein FlgB [Gammaproteobacteria bacterium]|jgi:flagellar basal-body rod protein FlgB|nr:flagellar basal body rod protein FlgB [Gammaproteobacteria bacterium]